MSQELDAAVPAKEGAQQNGQAAAQPAPPKPNGAAPNPSATRRVRARLARRITAQRAAPVKQVLEPLAVIHRELHPNADLGLLQRAYDVAEELHREPAAQVRRPLHHPPARRRDDPRRAGHGHHDAGRGAAARHGRGHRLRRREPEGRLRREGRRAGRRRHQAGQGQARHRPPRPRPSARWSSRWPRTRGCWSSSSPTGCTTCAPCASCRRRSRPARPARPSRSSPRSRTGSAWPR